MKEITDQTPEEIVLSDVEDVELDFSDTKDVIDAATIEQMANEVAESAAEGELAAKAVNVWEELTPAQRMALLGTESLGVSGRGTPQNPGYIDWNAVPKEWYVYWIAPGVVKAGLGMRGYRPVVRSEETQKWVPNCRIYGSERFFKRGTDILCAIPKRTWLIRKAAEYQSANVDNLQSGSEFRSAMSVLQKRLGLSKAQIAQLDREGDGLSLVRRPDPSGPDFVTAEAVEEANRRG